MARLPSFQPIEFLTGYRFDTYDPFLPDLPNGRRRKSIDELSSAEKKQIAAYKKELVQKSEQEIEDMVATVRAAIAEEGEKRHRFNVGNALATTETYSYWSKAAYWTLAEANALLIGRNPDVVTDEAVFRSTDRSVTAERYKSLRILINRAFDPRDNSTVRPARCLAWARGVNLDVPAELVAAVQPSIPSAAELLVENRQLREKLAELENLATPAAEKPVHPRERESLLKIVLAVATKKYHFDPMKAKNATATNIANAVHEVGFRIDEDTVRKFLNEAKNLKLDKD